MAAAERVVPAGPYCYSLTGNKVSRTLPAGETIQFPETKTCSFWKLRADKPMQGNGYCRLLKAGDWMPHPHGSTLLWDRCKECGINDED